MSPLDFWPELHAAAHNLGQTHLITRLGIIADDVLAAGGLGAAHFDSCFVTLVLL